MIQIFLIVASGYVSVWVRLFDTSLIQALFKFTQNFAIASHLLKDISEVDFDQIFNPPILAAFISGLASDFSWTFWSTLCVSS